MGKTDFRSLPAARRYHFRQSAIKMIESGKTRKHIAQLFGVRESTVGDWVRAYNKYGLKGLKDKKRGGSSWQKGKLDIDAGFAGFDILQVIIDKSPRQLNLPYYTWSRKAMHDLVGRDFRTELAINTMGDYLRNWGLTSNNPKVKIISEYQNRNRVISWIDQNYPLIKDKARKEKGTIYWVSQTGLMSEYLHRRTEREILRKKYTKWKIKPLKFNVVNARSNQRKTEFMVYSSELTPKLLLGFMKQLIKRKKKKLFLILSRRSPLNDKLIQNWLARNNDRIEAQTISGIYRIWNHG